MAYDEHIERVAKRKEALTTEVGPLFERIGDFNLEIGCGHGHWLTDFALSRSDDVFVGIDIIGDRIDRANRKAARAGLENVHFLKAEAGEFLELMPIGRGIANVYILFPDPWPKKRHWKNRLMNKGFLDELAARCDSGARLFFRTDHEGYFAWTRELLPELASWRKISGADWPFERETVFQSKAESYQSLVLAKVD